MLLSLLQLNVVGFFFSNEILMYGLQKKYAYHFFIRLFLFCQYLNMSRKKIFYFFP